MEYIFMNDSTDKQPHHDRRTRTRKEIKQLISERNEVLSLYCNLAGCDTSQNLSPDEIEPEVLQEFCQVLIDYIATGHFELYRRISEGEERRQDILDLANNIYPRIEHTTKTAVDFNDLYDDGIKLSENKDKLPEFLSRLGEDLATRIELEDQLINTLLSPSTSAVETLQ